MRTDSWQFTFELRNKSVEPLLHSLHLPTHLSFQLVQFSIQSEIAAEFNHYRQLPRSKVSKVGKERTLESNVGFVEARPSIAALRSELIALPGMKFETSLKSAEDCWIRLP